MSRSSDPAAASARRRDLLAGGASLILAAGGRALGAPTAPEPDRPGPRLGPPRPFSFEALKALADRIAGAPYAPPPPPDPVVRELDFDALQSVGFDPRYALFGGAAGPEVRLFPPGRQFPHLVRIFEVSGGATREVLFSPEAFHAPPGSPLGRLRGGGFAGFRLMNPGGSGDWLAFLGASYFRSAGPFDQYGLSARGVAVNSGGPAPEEFPRFSAFHLEGLGPDRLRIYALLEGESLAGAFRFDCARGAGGVSQEVEAFLAFRRPVETLGLAPLTSMFWYGADTPPLDRDWRPQIHDSDGLGLWTGGGERIFRPLQDPPRVITNSYLDPAPRGFGLLQRDRAFDDYQDDGAFYEKRPSLWTTPRRGFSGGAVRLVELPTTRETDDNVVAFYTPGTAPRAGETLEAAYRLDWTDREPGEAGLARVAATRTGRGGRPGQPPRPGWRRVSVDFEGEVLKGRDRLRGVEARVSSPSGAAIDAVSAYGLVGRPTTVRALFDVELQRGRPVDLRAFLAAGGETLSETWIYQLFPEA